MKQLLDQIRLELSHVIVGKDAVIDKLLMSLLSDGHILLDDVPGVGKTTLAVALSKTLGLNYKRIQFTPDVLPSDIVGFSMYDRERGAFRYMPGAVTGTNLLLGDEINRTSSKTQSALLEAMEERQATVDGTVYPMERPFCVIATQNQIGTAGTQPLPHAQLDRFLVRLSLGYPDFDSQVKLLRDRQKGNPLDSVRQIAEKADVLRMQEAVSNVSVHEKLLAYITRLSIASREHPMLSLGISPRGALFLSRMARACACLRGRDFSIVEDVMEVFEDVCAHRLLLCQRARLEHVTEHDVIADLLKSVPQPDKVK
ncbi:MAG: MoxR family ATPase [Oscillospiraceae bacterium]|nr:MoxR family ATPase [Oscillospiraceae bacterium]